MSATTDASARDGWQKARGVATFTDDLRAVGALHAAFTLSPYPHARIRGVDTSAAESVPGVAAVLTGSDISSRLLGRSVRDYPVLAVDRVLFVGQRVAAVAATDQRTAREAAGLVEVEYDPLRAVQTPFGALDGDAPVLHPQHDSYPGAVAAPRNVQGMQHRQDGAAQAAIAACEEVHEHQFSWPRTHSAPLEPHACLVTVADDEVHVYSSHKEPNKLRDDLATSTGRPGNEIFIHPVHIGGDFGAKGFPFLEVACYLLAVRTGRPVRSTMSYYEELTTTGARHPGSMRLCTGLRGGEIEASVVETLVDGGAFAGLKPQAAQVISLLDVPFASYRVPYRDERSMAVYTNSLPGGQVRSPGEYQATFAGESHIDMIARSRREDPIEFRLRHIRVHEAERVLLTLRDILREWSSAPHTAGPSWVSTGTGVAVFHRASGAGTTTVACVATRRGVQLKLSVPDQGAGSYEAFSRLAAEVLGVGTAHVSIEAVGASDHLVDAGSGASRVTTVAGRACVEACRSLLAALGGSPEEVMTDGYWIASRLRELGRDQVEGLGHWSVGKDDRPRTAPAHGALGVEVAIDQETGVVQVRRAALVVDAGLIVNPVGHRGQLEGGFVFGLSQALFEELRVEDGQVVSSSLGDYKLASASDVPPLDIRILEPEPVEDDPYDALKAVGELANLGAAPAIANAVDDAVGVRIVELPITAERIWRGLEGRRSGS